MIKAEHSTAPVTAAFGPSSLCPHIRSTRTVATLASSNFPPARHACEPSCHPFRLLGNKKKIDVLLRITPWQHLPTVVAGMWNYDMPATNLKKKFDEKWRLRRSVACKEN
ncbi:uncharacterized protein TrAFT101_006204 [Trichoderma asperellum]|uniref:uncharacterized protein n=1 Tax=Trichoderma asperellum TaxID=101201 RepID=UPI00332C34F3|nr:hypothetical protein TrAFT101_006204 [Trichoderma asperellum]